MRFGRFEIFLRDDLAFHQIFFTLKFTFGLSEIRFLFGEFGLGLSLLVGSISFFDFGQVLLRRFQRGLNSIKLCQVFGIVEDREHKILFDALPGIEVEFDDATADLRADQDLLLGDDVPFGFQRNVARYSWGG